MPTMKYVAPPKYWSGKVKDQDDMGRDIEDEFIDGKTATGPWAIMTPKSWAMYGITKDNSCGEGIGQRYKKQPDGRWLKVEG